MTTQILVHFKKKMMLCRFEKIGIWCLASIFFIQKHRKKTIIMFIWMRPMKIMYFLTRAQKNLFKNGAIWFIINGTFPKIVLPEVLRCAWTSFSDSTYDFFLYFLEYFKLLFNLASTNVVPIGKNGRILYVESMFRNKY